MAGQRILVATDGSDHANRAIDLAAELSARLGDDLSIVHVLMHGRPREELARMAEVEHLVESVVPSLPWSPASTPATLGSIFAEAEKEANMVRLISVLGEEIMQKAVSRAEAAGATGIKSHVVNGDYADEILDAAETDSVRMIVLGCRGLGRLKSAIMGSVSHKVLQQAPCTVVVVK